MTKPSDVLALAVAVSLLGVSAAAAATTTLDVLQEETDLSAGQGAVVWSRYDAATRTYHLVVRRAGVISLPQIAPNAVDFDADMGSDSAGRPAVVYSRCASYKHDRGPRDKCDLYRLSLATGKERRIAAASTRAASEYEPTLWRGELAWITERKGSFPTIYHRLLTAPRSRRSKRLPGIPARACDHGHSKQCSRVTAGLVENIELAGSRLAETIAYDVVGGSSSTEVRLVSLRSRKLRHIAFSNIGENNQMYVGLSFSSRKLAWFKGCFENPGCAGSGAYRFSLRNGRYQRARDRHMYAGWASTDKAIYKSQLRSNDDDACLPADALKPTPCLVLRDSSPAWKRIAAKHVR